MKQLALFDNSPKSILNLTIKKEWFELIIKGIKDVEYRDDKKYWERRLLDKTGKFKHFDLILFRNGYSPTSPQAIVECKGIKRQENVHLSTPYTLHIEKPVFAILLGNVLDITK